jgi:hypothetical protein
MVAMALLWVSHAVGLMGRARDGRIEDWRGMLCRGRRYARCTISDSTCL